MPGGHWSANAGGMGVAIAWGSPQNDLDLYVFDEDGNLMNASTERGTTSEDVFLPGLAASHYRVVTVPVLAVTADSEAVITLETVPR